MEERTEPRQSNKSFPPLMMLRFLPFLFPLTLTEMSGKRVKNRPLYVQAEGISKHRDEKTKKKQKTNQKKNIVKKKA